nr:signal recognition particle receptor subunit alpha [uncultured Ruminococcus sp.]
MLKSFTKIDDELFEELEELLVMGDVGVPTAEKICNRPDSSDHSIIIHRNLTVICRYIHTCFLLHHIVNIQCL